MCHIGGSGCYALVAACTPSVPELLATNALHQQYSGAGWLYQRSVELLTQVVSTRTTLHGEVHKSTTQATNLLGVAKELVKLEHVRMKAFYLAQEQKLHIPAVPKQPEVSALEALAALSMDDADLSRGPSPRPGAAPIEPLSQRGAPLSDAPPIPAGDKWSVVRNNVAQEMSDRKELNDVFEDRERRRMEAERVGR